MNATLASSNLTATDRCDRCTAQAYVRVIMPGGADLLFCGHHWNQHEPALRPKADVVFDETHRLMESATTDSR